MRILAFGRVLREDADRLQTVSRVRAADVGGHQPHQPGGVRRAHDHAQGVVHLPVGEGFHRLGHDADAFLHRQEPFNFGMGEDEDTHRSSFFTYGKGGNRSPIASRSSFDNFISIAFFAGSRRSGLRGPRMGAVTSGWAMTHASASEAMSVPRSSA